MKKPMSIRYFWYIPCFVLLSHHLNASISRSWDGWASFWKNSAQLSGSLLSSPSMGLIYQLLSHADLIIFHFYLLSHLFTLYYWDIWAYNIHFFCMVKISRVVSGVE